jgi:hypothetical protein
MTEEDKELEVLGLIVIICLVLSIAILCILL